MRTLRFLVGLLFISLSLLPAAASAAEPAAPVPQHAVAADSKQGDNNANPSTTTTPSPSEGTGETGSPGGTGNPGGTTGPSGVSVPRLMLQSLATDPATVTAGGTFTLSFTLVNTSTKTRVNNIKVTLSQGEGAFLPDAGSSSLYISTIKAEGTASRDVVFRSLPSLENRPYSMTMQVEYEDAQANAFSTTETISVNVEQPARADTSTFTVSPESVPVMQEATVNFSLNNMGKTKLYNASISIAEGQGVQPKTQFIGTVEPGAASNVELSVMAIEERMEPINAVISYEDAAGNVTTMEKAFTLYITPPMDMEDIGQLLPEEQEPTGFVIEAWMYWTAGGVLVALIASIVVWKILKKRRAAKEEADDLGLLDDDVLTPQA